MATFTCVKSTHTFLGLIQNAPGQTDTEIAEDKFASRCTTDLCQVLRCPSFSPPPAIVWIEQRVKHRALAASGGQLPYPSPEWVHFVA